jgi:hypothetical protein
VNITSDSPITYYNNNANGFIQTKVVLNSSWQHDAFTVHYVDSQFNVLNTWTVSNIGKDLSYPTSKWFITETTGGIKYSHSGGSTNVGYVNLGLGSTAVGGNWAGFYITTAGDITLATFV